MGVVTSPDRPQTIANGVDSTHYQKEPARLFSIRSGDTELALYLPLSAWQDAEQIKEAITQAKQGDCTSCDLLFQLLFQAEKSNYGRLVQIFMAELETSYLKENDPHAVLPKYLKLVSLSDSLRYYYTRHKTTASFTPGLFKLAKRGKSKVLCVFGGQGNTEDYIGEIERIMNAYEPLIADIFDSLSKTLFSISEGTIDISAWLLNRPQDPILVQAPSVSLSLAGIIQLLNYAVFGRVIGASIGDLPHLFARYSGHSQGVVSAIVASASQSDSHFIELSIKAIKMLYFIGLRAERVHPLTSLPPSILSDCASHNEGVPSPMLSISNLTFSQIDKHVRAANEILPENRKIQISLHNGPRSHVCSGPAISLHGLNVALRSSKCDSAEDQSRVPNSKRKLKFSTKFLPITAPFHCDYLTSAVDLVMDDLRAHNVDFDNIKLTVPVSSPFDGSDLNTTDLTKQLVSLICRLPVFWAKATECQGISHIIDFGPGEASGIGALTFRSKEGSGINVIIGSSNTSSTLDDRRSLFDRSISNVRFGVDWKNKFGPKIVESNGRRIVSTKFSRLLGLPPLMVAGMTPCTVSQTFVSACINAGYHVELAGGGHFTEKMLREKIDGILNEIPAGRGITLNSLFLNPRLWAIQYPLMKKMREEGYPIEGVCVAAGVPSLENANEIVSSLHSAGIRHISFKPGSIDSIYQVISIARHNPNVPIILQWTGGRGGGHHSFEDFHLPILETYSAIRSLPNLILVAGSGFGDGPGSLPYLTGEWSEHYSYPWMPFDGILLGSRVMVARENLASDSVKDLLVSSRGADKESDWEGTYSAPVGSILTVKSELGEPIHKVATRAVLLWKELDEQVFSLPRGEKRMKVLTDRKKYWIDRLNADHLKIWFGQREDKTICDLEEMTYSEVLLRLLELCYLEDQKKWIDDTYKLLVHEFILLSQSRFSQVEEVAYVPAPDSLSIDPKRTISSFISAFPKMNVSVLRTEDFDAFLQICMNPVRKPVPFIPVFDDNFEFWFKKDSLWASEDVDSVIDKDPQRTCILQGPVAVKYSTEKNVPVKDILDSINNHYIEKLAVGNIPKLSWFGYSDSNHIQNRNVHTFEKVANGQTIFIAREEETDWFSKLLNNRQDWFTAALQSPTVVGENKMLEPNPFLTLFKPRAGYEYVIRVNNGVTEQARIGFKGKTIVCADCTNDNIILSINHNAKKVVSLGLHIKFSPTYSPALLHVNCSSRESSIRQFYYSSWFGSENGSELEYLQTFDAVKTPIEHSESIDDLIISKFCAVVGNSGAAYSGLLGEQQAPMDFAVLLAWKSIIQCLFTPAGFGNLLYLVHLSNKISVENSDCKLLPGDNILTSANITAISNLHGKTVEVTAECKKGKQTILKVVSTFLYRRNVTSELFQNIPSSSWKVPIKSDEDAALLADLLKAKTWFSPIPNWHLKVTEGYDLVFAIDKKIVHPVSNGSGYKSMSINGSVVAKLSNHLSIPCGNLCLQVDEYIKEDPIEGFCKRHNGIPSVADLKKFAKTEGSKLLGFVSAPLSAAKYSEISGDYNPIHTHDLLADLLGLPKGPIIHGMWTSAAVRALLEVHLAENNPQRIIEYETRFIDMVPPGSVIEVSAEHIGMNLGQLVYKFEGRLKGASTLVVEGRINVDQPTTAYLFTGQGSQQVGMGMDLYAESLDARKIWDRADKHFRDNFGLSIIEIVKNNPKEVTVHFGGVRGQQIRKNYISLTYEDHNSKAIKQLIPSVTEKSDFYTFFSPAGLLNSTQFTQPALTLVAKAAFEDMKAKGLVYQKCAFAGHSLGEYASLAAVGDVIPLETLCDIVFYRGLTMQSAVQRDENGLSEYGMIAVNPNRVSPDFKEDALKFVVEGVSSSLKSLTEIVNLNIQDGQYVVAGNLRGLEVLTQTLNYIKLKSIKIAESVKEMPIEQVQKKLAEMIEAVTQEVDKKGKVVEVSKGYASIHLAGIDVPFHSSFLLSGVGPFRSILRKKLDPALVSVERLCGRYIPNLVGVVFDLSIEFCTKVYEASNSPVIGKILKQYPDVTDPHSQQLLAHTILVELLAYQFASPVQWIKTQNVLFDELKVEKFIEIGPIAILAGMAEKTIKGIYKAQDDVLSTKRTIWSYSGNKSQIYHEPNDVAQPAAIAGSVQAKEIMIAPPTGKESSVKIFNLPEPNVKKVSARNGTVEFNALDALRVSLSVKMKKMMNEIPHTKSIKELSGGKSTLQNELLADLQREFGDSGIPDRAEELPLSELASAIPDYSTKAPRKHTNILLNKLWSAKMPAGFTMSAAKSYLEREYSFDERTIESIMLFSPGVEPEKRMTSDQEAQSWLDALVKFVSSLKGVTLEKALPVSNSSNNSSLTISSAELCELKENQKALARVQIEALCSFLGEREREELLKIVESKQKETDLLHEEASEWILEHGDAYAAGIKSIFSSLKARRFDSHWNWSKQELFFLMFEIISNRLELVNRDLMESCSRLLNKSEPEIVAFMEYHLCTRRDELIRLSENNQGYSVLLKLGTELLDLMRDAGKQPVKYRDLSHPTCPVISIQADGSFAYSEGPRKECRNFLQYVDEMNRPFVSRNIQCANIATKVRAVKNNRKPLINVRKINPDDPLHWTFSLSRTEEFFKCMKEVAKEGLCLSGKAVLITGCGKGSIGGEMLKALLAAGANVIATTSSYSRKTMSYYQELYEEWGGRGSVLVVVPFNQASIRDIDALCNYITVGLGWSLDFFIPFAAINESGTTVDHLTDKNDLAHRAMLTNTHKLIGTIVRVNKLSETRPVHCIIPLSPNQGTFGGDGLYGETKAGLQALLHRWSAEQWKDRVTLVGAVIGWTRGTGLMTDNNLLASAMEFDLGIRTFSAREMAFNIMSMLHPTVVTAALNKPVYVDVSGGLASLQNLHRAASDVRSKLISASRLKKALFKESEFEQQLKIKTILSSLKVKPKSNINFGFNNLVKGDPIVGAKLRKLLDLDKVVVIVGYGEVGPYGSARTRWEMERDGHLSLAGFVEMAWTMGLIQYQKGVTFGKYSGWVDAKTKEPVEESGIPLKYGDYIMKHCGIRLIEPEVLHGYDPERKEQCQELVLTSDLPSFEVSREEADAYIRQHGTDFVDLCPSNNRVKLTLRKGAKIFVPKAAKMDRLVAGLIPTGWDPRRFGVPDDIANQVDPCSWYNLVSTNEALLQAGITDPYELYQFCHPSQIGNCCGGGEGGLRSNQRIFKNRFFDQPVQSDILQESFINTISAWVNLLLISASGPVKSPVGACATAVQSLELGVECIQNNRAQVVIVGGYDDISEESSCEFASMQATSNSVDEFKKGREPGEHCRPTASSRNGFMESHGAGSQILMSASLALAMGCPVYGVVAGTNTASDRQGRSIPAPGQGLLTTARKLQTTNNTVLKIMDIDYRLGLLSDPHQIPISDPESADEIIRMRVKGEKQTFGHDFWKNDPRIAPIEGALATYNLTIDDIGMASFHGTGTKANDINESDVLQKQLTHLERTSGNLLPCVLQKNLTGHPKGAACAWMLNGAMQAMGEAVIPGNRNADNIDSLLKDKTFLFFPNKSLQVEKVQACIIKSFGFGQVGGEAVILSPTIFTSMLTEYEFEEYSKRRRERELKAVRFFNNGVLENNIIKVKTSAPYPDSDQTNILLNPTARLNISSNSWTFLSGPDDKLIIPKHANCGIDIQYIPDLSHHLPLSPQSPFLVKNFTENELARVSKKPDQLASLAGIWAGKEAAFKALSQAKLVKSQGEGAGLLGLEIEYTPAPIVRHNGHLVKLSISHSGDYAIAIAIHEPK